MLRKEWREQLLILGLVFGVVALSVGGSLLAYNTSPPEAALNERHVVMFDGEEAQIEALMAKLGDNIGALDVGQARPAGAADPVELRASDPAHPQTASLIALLQGVFPSGPSEAAVTNGASRFLGVDVGDVIELDGITINVVGVVEDPTDLGANFVFLDHRDPAISDLTRSYAMFGDIDSFDTGEFDVDILVADSGGATTRSVLKVITAIATTLAMMLVGLVVSASFAVVGRRRVRQYGLLGAIGANEKHLRGAASFNGFAVGLLAGGAGTVLGIVAARLALPLLESSLNYRVAFEVQPTIVTVSLLLAVVMSTIAAWWPARAIARQPIVEALAARRPYARSPRNTTVLGLILTAGGFIVMTATIDTSEPTVPPLLAIVAIVIGVLLLTPAVVLIIGKITNSTTLPVRIAGRDLSRFQSRAAAALASIVLVLAIPVGIGLITASDDSRKQASPGNLPEDTAIVWAADVDRDGDIRMSDEFTGFDDPALEAEISRALPGSTVTPIDVVIDQQGEVFGSGETLFFAREAFFQVQCDSGIGNYVTGNDEGEWCFQTQQQWVATPELLDLWSLNLNGADVLTSRTDPVRNRVEPKEGAEFDLAAEFPEQRSIVAELPEYGAYPAALIAEDAILPTERRVTVGWLVTNDAPLIEDQVVELRSLMSDGAEVETLTAPTSDSVVRFVVALAGMLVGFAVLAATVTLIRGESADDIRVLDVLGASSQVRRSISAATAALLAFAGALLAVPIGAITLVIDSIGVERNFVFAVPWTTVIILFLVFPLLAAVGSGLLSPNPEEIR